ncbi:MAG: hypothetical protein E7658_07830 [Ruminococcaceae bacterium]|nr:hypothetical protein [Oscillospiraceae bacterium]
MTNTGNKTMPAEELLSEIHRNLVMGSENLCSVVPRIRNRHLLKEVTSQLEQYAAYTRTTAAMMKERAIRPKKSYPWKTVMVRGNIALNTMFDKSDSHIAEMISRGTRLGADQLEKTVYRMRSRGCHPDIVAFGRNVVSFERREAEDITRYR